MMVVGFVATLLPYAGSGPFWFRNEGQSKNCARHSWQHFLFITNLIQNEGEMGGKYLIYLPM